MTNKTNSQSFSRVYMKHELCRQTDTVPNHKVMLFMHIVSLDLAKYLSHLEDIFIFRDNSFTVISFGTANCL